MKTIIVPFDFSKEARNGITFACQLARHFSASIMLTYVQKHAPDFGHIGIDVERDKVQEEFGKLLEELKSSTQGIHVDFSIRRGKVYKEVVALGESCEDAVIVLSTHGASGFEEFFVGSNTLRTIASTTLPVFTIRHEVDVENVETIIFPLDTSLHTRQKAPYVAELAAAWGANVHIVSNCLNAPEEITKKIKLYAEQVVDFFNSKSITTEVHHREHKDLVDAVLLEASHLPHSLIAITSTDKESPRILMIGDNAQRLMSRADVPVVVLAPRLKTIVDSFRTFGASMP